MVQFHITQYPHQLVFQLVWLVRYYTSNNTHISLVWSLDSVNLTLPALQTKTLGWGSPFGPSAHVAAVRTQHRWETRTVQARLPSNKVDHKPGLSAPHRFVKCQPSHRAIFKTTTAEIICQTRSPWKPVKQTELVSAWKSILFYFSVLLGKFPPHIPVESTSEGVTRKTELNPNDQILLNCWYFTRRNMGIQTTTGHKHVIK